MSWSQKELEALYKEANEKAGKDPEYRKRLESDAASALGELTGKKLPEGLELKVIGADSKYAGVYSTPDFTGGELDLKDLRSVSGGEGEENFFSAEVGSNAGVSVLVSICSVNVACPADNNCDTYNDIYCVADSYCAGYSDSLCSTDGQCIGDGDTCSFYMDTCGIDGTECGVEAGDPDHSPQVSPRR